MSGHVTIREAGRDDAHMILSIVSTQTQAEFDVLGRSPMEVAEGALAAGEPVFVSTLEDRPMALFGFHDFGSYVSMWTIATQAYFDTGIEGVLRTRRFFRNLDFGKPICVVTVAPHCDTDRWLGLLGFQKIAHDGTRREFLYPRR